MNLKEAFRYQNFLSKMMDEATIYIGHRDHCLKISKKHKRSEANPEAEDLFETVEREEFFSNDIVVAFMQGLVYEKYDLTVAINKAKSGLSFDIDAALETNKFKQRMSQAIKIMFNYQPISKIEKGTGYKFDINGTQVPYCYDIEVTSERDFDYHEAKAIMKSTVKSCDDVSREIDEAMINAVVDYTPKYDVNDDFDDVLNIFVTNYCNDLSAFDDVDK